MNELWYGLLDLLLPRRCLKCHTVVPSRTRPVPICEEHWSQVRVVRGKSCRYCARPMETESSSDDSEAVSYPLKPICGTCRKTDLVLEFLAAGFRFGPVLRDVVSDWKFEGHPEWGPWLGERLADAIRNVFNPRQWDFVAPVPMYYRRREERGFNQARQLAKALSKDWEVPFNPALRKHRRTDPQASLGRQDRMRNLTGAFSLHSDSSSVENRSILLVDDIYTTGSTLRTAAGVLLDAGAEDVAGVVLARTPPESS